MSNPKRKPDTNSTSSWRHSSGSSSQQCHEARAIRSTPAWQVNIVTSETWSTVSRFENKAFEAIETKNCKSRCNQAKLDHSCQPWGQCHGEGVGRLQISKSAVSFFKLRACEWHLIGHSKSSRLANNKAQMNLDYQGIIKNYADGSRDWYFWLPNYL